MSRKMKDGRSLPIAGKRRKKDDVETALETFTTAHSLIDEQEAEAVRKKIRELPEEMGR